MWLVLQLLHHALTEIWVRAFKVYSEKLTIIYHQYTWIFDRNNSNFKVLFGNKLGMRNADKVTQIKRNFLGDKSFLGTPQQIVYFI